MTARLLPIALTTALLLPAAASAQSPAAPAPPAAAAQAAQAQGRLEVIPSRIGRTGTVLVGSSVRIRAVLKPYVAGQKVRIRIEQNGRRVLLAERTVQRSATGNSGTVLAAYTPRAAGPLSIRASHLTTPELASVASSPATVGVLPRSVPQGASGRSVRIMQQRLKALGYVIGEPGSYDGRTQRAVLAFRKQTGMSRIASADKPFFQAMARGAGAFKVRFPRHGRHIEADLTHQTLALIGAGGRVERIYPISSGAPVTPTIIGSFKIYRKDYGVNALGMVHASYFIRGYAIHGYHTVPTFPASHGCLRVPTPDARSISNWGRHGTIVDTYHR